jgi:uncharacterized protein Yka (UPF0111/DUF47 family)
MNIKRTQGGRQLVKIYLDKSKRLALLMMIYEAEAMIGDTADGWFGLSKTNPEFYDEITQAISEMKDQLEKNGNKFEKDVRPIIRY